MRLDAVIFVFWMLSFKPAFSLSSFTSRGSLVLLHSLPLGWCHMLIWSSWYFSWKSWFQLESSSEAFCIMYSAYKLNKQSDNIEPWCIPFPILNQSIDPCPVLTVASCFAYRFLRRQVMYFNVVNEGEVNVFLEFSCFFYDPAYFGNLISGSSTFSKSSLYNWTFSVHVPMKPSLKDFKHSLASMWNWHNCTVILIFFGIVFPWD